MKQTPRSRFCGGGLAVFSLQDAKAPLEMMKVSSAPARGVVRRRRSGVLGVAGRKVPGGGSGAAWLREQIAGSHNGSIAVGR